MTVRATAYTYTGNNCFDTTIVLGYSLVPLPPASTIPFISFLSAAVRQRSRTAKLYSSLNSKYDFSATFQFLQILLFSMML